MVNADIAAEFVEAGLSVRNVNALLRNGYRTGAAVAAATDAELLGAPQLGPGSLVEIRAAFPHVPSPGPAADPAPEFAGAGRRGPRDGAPAGGPPHVLGAVAGVPVTSMGLSERTTKALLGAGLCTVGDVEQHPRRYLMALPGFDSASLYDWLDKRAKLDTRRRRPGAGAAAVRDTKAPATKATQATQAPVSPAALGRHVGEFLDSDNAADDDVAAALAALGIATLNDLASWDEGALRERLGPAAQARVVGIARTQRVTFSSATSSPTWVAGWDALVDYAATHAHARPSRDVIHAGIALGVWVGQVRDRYRRGTLPAACAFAVETLPGWYWTRTEKDEQALTLSAMRVADLLRQFVAREGHPHVPARHVENGVRLGFEVRRLRSLRATLSDDAQDALSTVPGFIWCPDLAAAARQAWAQQERANRPRVVWESWLARLAAYTKTHGHADPPREDPDEETAALGRWVAAQRRERANLGLGKQAALESLPGWEWDGTGRRVERVWDEGFARVLAYARAHGTADVPAGHIEGDGFALGAWVTRQHRRRPDGMPERQRRRLEMLPGWVWREQRTRVVSPHMRAAHEDHWQNQLDALASYVADEGRFPTTKTVTADGTRLGAWVAEQRSKRRRGTLSAARAAKLERVPGWSWDPPVGRPARNS